MYKLIRKELCMLCNDHLMPYSGPAREAHLRACAENKIGEWTPDQRQLFCFGGHFPQDIEQIIRERVAALHPEPLAKQAVG